MHYTSFLKHTVGLGNYHREISHRPFSMYGGAAMGKPCKNRHPSVDYRSPWPTYQKTRLCN